MKARQFAAYAVIVAAVLTGCSGKPAPAPSATPKVTAQTVVNQLSLEWPLPDVTDTSTGCDCVARITTGAVTVAEFADQAAAGQWLTAEGRTGDNRQAGRFVLSWVGGDHAMVDEPSRVDMVKRTEQLQAR